MVEFIAVFPKAVVSTRAVGVWIESIAVHAELFYLTEIISSAATHYGHEIRRRWRRSGEKLAALLTVTFFAAITSRTASLGVIIGVVSSFAILRAL